MIQSLLEIIKIFVNKTLMLKILILPIFICSIVLAASTVQKPVNVDCPYSDNKIKNGETLQFGVCCSNCLKKATSNLPEFLKKLSQTTKHVHIQQSQLEKNLLSDSVVRNVKRRHQVSFVPIRFD